MMLHLETCRKRVIGVIGNVFGTLPSFSDLYWKAFATLSTSCASFPKIPRYFKLWLSNSHYYNARAFFNSRMAPVYGRLRNLSEGAL